MSSTVHNKKDPHLPNQTNEDGIELETSSQQPPAQGLVKQKKEEKKQPQETQPPVQDPMKPKEEEKKRVQVSPPPAQDLMEQTEEEKKHEQETISKIRALRRNLFDPVQETYALEKKLDVTKPETILAFSNSLTTTISSIIHTLSTVKTLSTYVKNQDVIEPNIDYLKGELGQVLRFATQKIADLTPTLAELGEKIDLIKEPNTIAVFYERITAILDLLSLIKSYQAGTEDEKETIARIQVLENLKVTAQSIAFGKAVDTIVEQGKELNFRLSNFKNGLDTVISAGILAQQGWEQVITKHESNQATMAKFRSDAASYQEAKYFVADQIRLVDDTRLKRYLTANLAEAPIIYQDSMMRYLKERGYTPPQPSAAASATTTTQDDLKKSASTGK